MRNWTVILFSAFSACRSVGKRKNTLKKNIKSERMKYSVSFLLLLAIVSNCNGQNGPPRRPAPNSRPGVQPGNPNAERPGAPPQRPAPNAPSAPNGRPVPQQSKENAFS